MNWKMRVHRESLLRSLGYTGGKIPSDECRTVKNHLIQRRDYNRETGQMENITIFHATIKISPTPKTVRKSSKHRIHIICPRCKKLIPYGRLHQHYGTGACKIK